MSETISISQIKTFIEDKHFIVSSCALYGGNSGFQDYSINGIMLKNNLIQHWKNYFINNVDIYEIETSTILPHAVLKASGHVDKFTDRVVYDENNICYRADHLVQDWYKLNKTIDINVDEMNLKELENHINLHRMLPNQTSDIIIQNKNLMFNMNGLHDITETIYLRPELAQGIFINFSHTQKFLKRDVPFGLAQIGKSYRNEISPKPFTRLREFTQAEIEYFVTEDNKTHKDYDNFSHIVIPIYCTNLLSQLDINKLVNDKIIKTEAMGYFLAKIYLFVKSLGFKDNDMRFRKHNDNELAHYSSECWDLEININGWLECIGCADRGNYDLMCHKVKCKKTIPVPIIINKKKIKPNLPILGKKYKNATKNIVNWLEKAKLSCINSDNTININIDGNNITLIQEDYCVIDVIKHKKYIKYVPHVIEPSFGIDRLIFAMMAKLIKPREQDPRRLILCLPYHLRIYDIALFTLMEQNRFDVIFNILKSQLMQFKLYCDCSNVSIGKKYVRADELGIPFAITIDVASLTDMMVTIRDRDSMVQIRIDINNLVIKIKNLLCGVDKIN